MNFYNETLEWDEFCWEGTVDGPVLPTIKSTTVDLVVETEDEEEMPPHDLQVETWRSLIEKGTDYSSMILSGFYDYCQLMRPHYLLSGEDCAKNMPEISSATEIRPMLSLNSVNIGWPYDGVVAVGFAFECQWDQEHGAGIVFKNGKQVDVGGVDCLY